MNDLISVIVPVYNAEKYIVRCVESICNQSYPYFELILVNDGSKDNSLKMCRELAATDNRIVVLDRTNGGASAARNTGIKAMKGKYVVFADSDDYVSPSYLENLYIAAQKGRYDIVQCGIESTSDTKKQMSLVLFNEKDLTEVSKTQALNERKYKVSVCGKIYLAYLFEDYFFQEGIIYEDDASYYIFVDRAERIAVLNETLYYYYMSENSVMRNDHKNKSTAFIGIYQNRIRYFQNRNNEELLDGTYARFCLVLMLNISASLVNGNNVSDRREFINIFKEYFPFVMRSNYICLKDKIMFMCFRTAPNFVGKIIGKIRG